LEINNKIIMSVYELLKKFYFRHNYEIFNVLEQIGVTKLTRLISTQIYLNKNKRHNLTELNKLIRDIPLLAFLLMTPELHKSNDWYGHGAVFKKYINAASDSQLKTIIEHGVFFDSYLWEQDMKNNFPFLITFGKPRKDFLKDYTNKKVIPIGPYIHYATSFLSSDQLILEKKRLGRSLLVFPSHSSSVINSFYDVRSFCKRIKIIAKNFDTVRVCLYWRDIKRGTHKLYLEHGFECVTAGHIFDPLFLPRLKSIIETSSVTISNSIGTHIGYCLLLNKPHYIYSQKIKYEGNLKQDTKFEKSKLHENIQNVFGNYAETISKQQYDLVNLYWGLDQIKTREEMKQIFDEAERLYRK